MRLTCGPGFCCSALALAMSCGSNPARASNSSYVVLALLKFPNPLKLMPYMCSKLLATYCELFGCYNYYKLNSFDIRVYFEKIKDVFFTM